MGARFWQGPRSVSRTLRSGASCEGFSCGRLGIFLWRARACLPGFQPGLVGQVVSLLYA